MCSAIDLPYSVHRRSHCPSRFQFDRHISASWFLTETHIQSCRITILPLSVVTSTTRKNPMEAMVKQKAIEAHRHQQKSKSTALIRARMLAKAHLMYGVIHLRLRSFVWSLHALTDHNNHRPRKTKHQCKPGLTTMTTDQWGGKARVRMAVCHSACGRLMSALIGYIEDRADAVLSSNLTRLTTGEGRQASALVDRSQDHGVVG